MRKTVLLLASMAFAVLLMASGVALAATISCSSGSNYFDQCEGTNNDDTIIGTRGSDYINGKDGEDNIASLAGNDAVLGGTGGDEVSGGGGFDFINGEATGGYNHVNVDEQLELAKRGAGNDVLSGESHPDIIYGGFGNDTLSGRDGDDAYFDPTWGCGGIGHAGPCPGLAGEAGDDRLSGGDGDDALYGGFRVAVGLAYQDPETGKYYYHVTPHDPGFDVMSGGAGNDYMDGGAGSDTISGGSGDDTVRDGASRYPTPQPDGDYTSVEGYYVGEAAPDSSKDILSGGDGKDVLDSLDGPAVRVRDVVSCGRGTDIAYADNLDKVASDCEEVKQAK